MKIDTFADNTFIYPDLQPNKVELPEEIITNGFKPPVKLPDGSLQPGSILTAPHINYLLNELFSRIKTLEDELAELKNG